MYEIELPGLPAFHPAAALAVYGLYALIPNCKIHYKLSKMGTHFPVLHSNFKTIEELSDFLTQENTWTSINLPGKTNKELPELPANLNETQLKLTEFLKLKEYDQQMATGIGTDLKLKIDKSEINCYRSPFYMVDATSWTFIGECSKVLNLLINQKINAQNALMTFPWTKQKGPNFGFFFDSVSEYMSKNNLVKSARNALKKAKKGNKKRKSDDDSENLVTSSELDGQNGILTVPVVCMLGIAGWRLLPCFVQGNDVVTPGWMKNEFGLIFTYPVFTKPHTAAEAVSWLCNPKLQEFTKNRAAWNKLGIHAVYQTRKKPGPKGGGNLMSAFSL